jgi:hypothetical protein
MRKMSEKKQSEKNINSIMKRQKLNAIMKRHKLNTMRSGSSGKNEIVGIKKQYLKSDGSCKVTLSLPKEAAPDAQVVAIVGDFNNWNLTETQMKKLKSGDFQYIDSGTWLIQHAGRMIGVLTSMFLILLDVMIH